MAAAASTVIARVSSGSGTEVTVASAPLPAAAPLAPLDKLESWAAEGLLTTGHGQLDLGLGLDKAGWEARLRAAYAIRTQLDVLGEAYAGTNGSGALVGLRLRF